MVKETRAAAERLLAIHHAGGYRPHLGAVLPLAELVAAHRLAGSGHKRGNVVVRI
jgi:NADPH:quinone reductase-like Zn-dependent oxidoreductase